MQIIFDGIGTNPLFSSPECLVGQLRADVENFAMAVAVESRRQRASFNRLDAALAGNASIIGGIRYDTKQMMAEFCWLRGWLYQSHITMIDSASMAKIQSGSADYLRSGGTYFFGDSGDGDPGYLFDWGFVQAQREGPFRNIIFKNMLIVDDRVRAMMSNICDPGEIHQLMMEFESFFRSSVHDYFHNFTIITAKERRGLFGVAANVAEQPKILNPLLGQMSRLREWYTLLNQNEVCVGVNLGYEFFSNQVQQWVASVQPPAVRQKVLRAAERFICHVAAIQSRMQDADHIKRDEALQFGAYWAQAVFWPLTILFNPNGDEFLQLAPAFASLALPIEGRSCEEVAGKCRAAYGNHRWFESMQTQLSKPANQNIAWVRGKTALASGGYFEKLWIDPHHVNFAGRRTPVPSAVIEYIGNYRRAVRPKLLDVIQSHSKTIIRAVDPKVRRHVTQRFCRSH